MTVFGSARVGPSDPWYARGPGGLAPPRPRGLRDHHGGGPRHHGGGQPRRARGRRPLDRLQHRAAVRAAREPVRRHPHQLPLLPGAEDDVHQVFDRLPDLPGRLRDPRRALRGPHPDPDGQDLPVPGRPVRPLLLGGARAMAAGAGAARGQDRAHRHEPVPDDGRARPGRARGPRRLRRADAHRQRARAAGAPRRISPVPSTPIGRRRRPPSGGDGPERGRPGAGRGPRRTGGGGHAGAWARSGLFCGRGGPGQRARGPGAAARGGRARPHRLGLVLDRQRRHPRHRPAHGGRGPGALGDARLRRRRRRRGRRRARDADGHARAAQHHLGVHGCADLPDAPGAPLHRAHLAGRGSGPPRRGGRVRGRRPGPHLCRRPLRGPGAEPGAPGLRGSGGVAGGDGIRAARRRRRARPGPPAPAPGRRRAAAARAPPRARRAPARDDRGAAGGARRAASSSCGRRRRTGRASSSRTS